MIPVCDHTEETSKKYAEIWNDLKIKLTERGYLDGVNKKHPSIRDCCDNADVETGYANCQYSGTLKPDLDDLTDLQVAMLCDGGYSWFGGNCSKSGLKFYVKVYTD